MINNVDKIPGFFFIQDIDFVRKSKGESAVKKLTEILKEDLDFKKISSVKRYPIATEIKLISECCKLIWGNDSVNSWEKWGVHDFETVQKSPLGKVMLALSKNPIDAIRNGAKMFSFFNPAIIYSYKKINDNSSIVVIKNNPYPKEYFYGLFSAFLKYYHLPYSITVNEEQNQTHVYNINWKLI